MAATTTCTCGHWGSLEPSSWTSQVSAFRLDKILMGLWHHSHARDRRIVRSLRVSQVFQGAFILRHWLWSCLRNGFLALGLRKTLLLILPFLYLSHSFDVRPSNAFLAEADRLAWLGNWNAAGPLYQRAERLFKIEGNSSKEIHARIGRIRAQGE